MPDVFAYSWYEHFIGSLASASLICWFVLGRRRPFLQYTLRQPVPWNAVAGAFIVAMVAIRAVAFLFGHEIAPPDELTDPLMMAQRIVQSMLTQLLMFGTLFAAVVVISRATLRDVGLPLSAREFGRDVKLGTVAWLAALLPVYGLQAALVQFAGEKSSHPLIRMILEDSNTIVLAMASLAAVVVAPICEEIAFRLLLQGWLEKLEDQWLGWRTVSATADEIAADDEAASVAPLAPDPPSRGVAGLPYGWAPILVSSLVFAAGHLGHGPDPIALFVLAIILGYVYQRSHHILPCILMHSLFNLTTLGTLFWGLADHNQ